MQKHFGISRFGGPIRSHSRRQENPAEETAALVDQLTGWSALREILYSFRTDHDLGRREIPGDVQRLGSRPTNLRATRRNNDARSETASLTSMCCSMAINGPFR
jgi:hypothetical protein